MHLPAEWWDVKLCWGMGKYYRYSEALKVVVSFPGSTPQVIFGMQRH